MPYALSEEINQRKSELNKAKQVYMLQVFFQSL